jgi:CRISPR-associated protein Csx10
MFEVTLTAEEPLALGVAPQAGNVVDSWALVPGSVLRGALAARWIAHHGPPNTAAPADRAQFLELFEGDIRYGPLLADHSAIEPLSVQRCKYRPQSTCWAQVHDASAQDAGPPPTSCPHCGGPMTAGKGTVVGLRLGEATRTQLDPDETVAAGRLFSRRHIPAGTRLRGHIVGQHPWLAAPPTTIWVGGRRSTGGRARLQLRPATSPPPALRRDATVVVRLEAPGIFVDAAGRPTLDPDPTELADVLGTTAVVVRSWRRPSIVRGWHAASGLPKPADHAVAAGSVFVLGPTDRPDPQALGRLAGRGLGLRRSEGFGHLTVNPPAWTPPAASTGAPAPSPAVELIDQLRADPALPRLRGWLRDHLTDAAEALEHGQGLAIEPILTERRLRGMPASTLAAVRRLLELQSVELLADAITLLEDPAW